MERSLDPLQPSGSPLHHGNAHMGTSNSTELYLNHLFLVAETVSDRPHDKFAEVGSIIIFECLTNGSEPIIYHWFKDSVRIEEDGDRILGLNESILIITTVESSDYGYYRCDVNNLVNADLSEHTLLTGVCS